MRGVELNVGFSDQPKWLPAVRLTFLQIYQIFIFIDPYFRSCGKIQMIEGYQIRNHFIY
jgi:hypothetical protein